MEQRRGAVRREIGVDDERKIAREYATYELLLYIMRNLCERSLSHSLGQSRFF